MHNERESKTYCPIRQSWDFCSSCRLWTPPPEGQDLIPLGEAKGCVLWVNVNVLNDTLHGITQLLSEHDIRLSDPIQRVAKTTFPTPKDEDPPKPDDHLQF